MVTSQSKATFSKVRLEGYLRVDEPNADGWRAVTVFVPPDRGGAPLDEVRAIRAVVTIASKTQNTEHVAQYSAHEREVECVECCQIFSTKARNAKYCSMECRIKSHANSW